MKNYLSATFTLTLLFFSLTACQKKSESKSIISGSTVRSIVLAYLTPASSPSADPNPIFTVSRNGGSGFNGGTVIRAYSGSSCNTLLTSQTIPTYTSSLALTVAISAPGTYEFSINMTDPFVGAPSDCSLPISYTYNAPAAPTSIDLLSLASPSSNPNPKIRVNGIGSNLVEVYLNNTCAGNPFITASSPIFILPPLQLGTYELYAKTLTDTGVKSLCSSKLLDYQSLFNFSLNLSITANALTFDYTNIESDDVDGDGNGDYAFTRSDWSASGVYFGTGTGSFGNLRTLSFAGAGTAIKIADVDGDGRKDILMGDDNRNLYLFRNNGGRSFTRSTLEALGSNAFDSISYIEFLDVNGDANKDIILGAPRDGKAFLKLSNGNGTYQAAVDLMGAVNVGPFQIIDVNHDTRPDLAARGASDYKFYLNNGSAVFSLSSTVSTSISYGQTYIEDMNGDAWPDIITADATQAKIMLNNTAGGFGADLTTTLAYSLYPTSSRVVDLDGDGKKDLLFYDVTFTSIAIFPGNGDGTLKYPLLYPIKSQGPFTVFDVNNDGKKDVLGSSVLIQN